MDKKIVTLTINPALDKITGISNVVPNQKLRCKTPNHEAGGGGINVSRAIRLLEGQSLAIFPCGGPNGEILKSRLDDENVGYKAISIQEPTRENLTIFEGNTKQQYRFIMPGPTLSEEEWEQTLDELKNLDPQPDYIVCSGSMPPSAPDNFFKKIAKIARNLKARLIVDTSGEPLLAAADAGVYLLKPNMRELGNLAGTEIESEAHQIEAAQELVDSGKAEVVVVSLGAGGALLVTEEISEQIRTPTVPIRSKLGAGDSMVAGIVFSLAKGNNIQKAVRYGIAAGAATVMTPGFDLCSKSDTDMLYERITEKE